jgi:hypothetical protein
MAIPSTRRFLPAFIALLVLIALMTVATVASAQQKSAISTTGEGVKSRYVQQHIIDVDDVPGHQIRIQETQRINPGSGHSIDGVRITEEWVRGFSNYINGSGPAWGHVTWIMEDGSKILLEYTGTSETQQTASGSRRGTYHGVSRITGGTNRFAKIRGRTVDVAEFDTDPSKGYNRVSSNGEYWFEN